MTRFSALWSLFALLASIPFAFWYIRVLPDQAQSLVLGKSPTIIWLIQWGLAAVVILFILMLITGVLKPQFNNKVVASVAMVCALFSMGSFEWIREAARRPFVLNEVMYSNSIMKKDVERINSEGYLKSALWIMHKEVTDVNIVAAGKELYVHQCYACHTLGGKNNDIVKLTENMSYTALSSYIKRIHQVRYFMPPFVGTDQEVKALATYLAGELHGKDVSEPVINSGDVTAMGGSIFENHCSACHDMDEVVPYYEGSTKEKIAESFLNLDQISEEMVPFEGSDDERHKLATYFFTSSSGEAAPAKLIDGKKVFENHCSACHGSVELVDTFSESSLTEALEILKTLDQLSDMMEPFEGSVEETNALAEYLKNVQGGI